MSNILIFQVTGSTLVAFKTLALKPSTRLSSCSGRDKDLELNGHHGQHPPPAV